MTASRKLDRKPRQRAEPNLKVSAMARAKRRLVASKASEQGASVRMADRSPGGCKTAVVFGSIAGGHILGASPAVAFAYALRSSLASIRYPRPDVKVYGSDGKTLVATINAETRTRTPIGAPRPGDQTQP